MGSTKSIEEMNIDSNYATALWHALFAMTHAIECLEYHVDVDGLKHEETGMGAYEFARRVLLNAVVQDEE
tara:strand:+ start:1382 stop:1591 length:210 start_codon:yes stop_codon:yes gene_type:complete